MSDLTRKKLGGGIFNAKRGKEKQNKKAFLRLNPENETGILGFKIFYLEL